MNDRPVSEPAAPMPADTVSRMLGRGMYAVRWVMAPLYLGLLAVLALLAVKFVQKLVAAIPGVLASSSNQVILTALNLIDILLVANLVLMVMFAGWENFVAPLRDGEGRARRLGGLGPLDFGGLKLKLIASVSVIATIFLLETALDIRDTPMSELMMHMALTLCLPVIGVLLAVMDRVAGH